MGILDGKVALITGAGRGQGRAHAVTCAREGADVVVVDIAEQIATVPYAMSSEADLAETAAQAAAFGRRVVSAKADVRSQKQLDEAVSRGIAELGKIDILIANAGIWSTMAPFWEMTDEEWEDVVGVDLTGAWRSAKAVAPHMIERRGGSIVITASTNGMEPGRNYSHYTAAKHGVIGLMKNIALELAPYGIRCNSINPGAVRTGMTEHQAAYDMYAGHPGGTEADLVEGGYRFHALKGSSFLSPQVIADTALYLNSDLAASVTGANIPVDAGHLLLTGVNPDPVRE